MSFFDRFRSKPATPVTLPDLVAQNQALGRQIDALRERRRALRAEIDRRNAAQFASTANKG